MINFNNQNQSEEQKKQFDLARKAGMWRQLAQIKGGTGDLRKELNSKEQTKRKTKRKMVKMSRKGNR